MRFNTIELDHFDDKAVKKAARRILTKAFAKEHQLTLCEIFMSYRPSILQIVNYFYDSRAAKLICEHLKQEDVHTIYKNCFQV